MIVKLSPLKWERFALIQSSLRMTKPPPEGVDLERIHDNYVIDVNFRHIKLEDKSFQVFTLVKINGEPSIAGYQIVAEGVGHFRFADVEIDPEHRSNQEYYSTVNLVLNRLRAHISDITAHGLLGTYTLPPIDVTDLFHQKSGHADQPKKEVPPAKAAHSKKPS